MISSGHRPTVAMINLGNIKDNLDQIRRQLPSRTQIWAVVKANAYGHGAIQVAQFLQGDVSGFCVSNIDEALELRMAGIDLPLLVMGVIPAEAVRLAIAHDIEVTLASQEWLDHLLTKVGEARGLKVHLKLDTGMGRIGFRDKMSLTKSLKSLLTAGMVFQGVFTHFASADEQEEIFFQEQVECFQELLTALPQRPKVIHASNSAAAIWHREALFDAVRLGDVLYGLNPSGDILKVPFPLKPALTLSSSLIHVKEVPAGSCVGYGGSYRTTQTEWIGTIPIGYADGLLRNMQGFHLLIAGHLCEIVGRVSMDQITVRLDKAYPLGTPVTLIGQERQHQLTVQDWANYRQTINYEVVCLLSDRIARHYVQ